MNDSSALLQQLFADCWYSCKMPENFFYAIFFLTSKVTHVFCWGLSCWENSFYFWAWLQCLTIHYLFKLHIHAHFYPIFKNLVSLHNQTLICVTFYNMKSKHDYVTYFLAKCKQTLSQSESYDSHSYTLLFPSYVYFIVAVLTWEFNCP